MSLFPESRTPNIKVRARELFTIPCPTSISIVRTPLFPKASHSAPCPLRLRYFLPESLFSWSLCFSLYPLCNKHTTVKWILPRSVLPTTHHLPLFLSGTLSFCQPQHSVSHTCPFSSFLSFKVLLECHFLQEALADFSVRSNFSHSTPKLLQDVLASFYFVL